MIVSVRERCLMVKIVHKFIYKEFLASKIVWSNAQNHSNGFLMFFSNNTNNFQFLYNFLLFSVPKFAYVKYFLYLCTKFEEKESS